MLDGDTILVGHSLGPAFILSVLEEVSMKKQVRACFFVSGFLGLLDNPAYDALNTSFTTKKFDWKVIKKSCRHFYMLNADNDPYVPLKKGKELAEKISADCMIVKNGGHINEESGFKRFDVLLDLIKKEL